MACGMRPAKAKAAQRVIEVLDFFDEQHRQATVMDIARHYNRPQSSTSELLASLVDLGLLYKDPGSRSYTLTPRAAILGSISQPQLVRDGRLSGLIEDLRDSTGLGVVLIGMVGPNAQVFRSTAACASLDNGGGRMLPGGALERLSDTAAGWLLLSTLAPPRRDGLVRRLNAEAPEERKFNYPEMSARVQESGRRGFAIGPAGFGLPATMAAVLLNGDAEERPMALGIVSPANREVDPLALVATLQRSVQRLVAPLVPPEFGFSAANAA